mmetsp:Transcript_16651/g.16335  ORF Transcript_16651/g.16335 Transcript_16651/m.16335 type:complete len:83 (+) Transcript_16651:417-665(+)
MLFDSQVLDTQEGYMDPPPLDFDRIYSHETLKIVRDLVIRKKITMEKKRDEELVEARDLASKRTQKQLGEMYQQKINSLEEL